MDVLCYCQTIVSYDVLQRIYGNDLGKHLHQKWKECNSNILFFYSRLDKVNKSKLIHWINTTTNSLSKLIQ